MELHETLLWLASIPSPTGEEGPLCDAIAARLAPLSPAEPVRRHHNSLVVPLTRGTGGPKVLLVGNLDVVRTSHGGPPRVEGPRLFGPGAADMKSGLALMVDLAEGRAPPGVDLTLVFHACGEAGYYESELQLVFNKEPELVKQTDLAVVLKPTDNKLQLGSAGSAHALLRFTGRTAHSGRPGAGVNAIHGASSVLARLAAWKPVPDVVADLTWYEMMSALSAHGGRAGQVVPDQLDVTVHHTFGPSTSLHDSQERLIALVAGSGVVRFEDLSPSAVPSGDHPLVRALADSGVRGVEARLTWTEVARFAEIGIAAATFGPGNEAEAHVRNESTDLAALQEGRAILDRWFARIGINRSAPTPAPRAKAKARRAAPPRKPAPRAAKAGKKSTKKKGKAAASRR